MTDDKRKALNTGGTEGRRTSVVQEHIEHTADEA